MGSLTARTAWHVAAVIALLVGGTLGLRLADPTSAAALEPIIACSPPLPQNIELVDAAGTSTATHELSLLIGSPGYPITSVDDLVAPGARIVPRRDGETARLVVETPGPLTVSALIGKGGPCPYRVSKTFDIKPPTPLAITRLKGPGRRADGHYPYDVHLSFSVKPTKTSDRSPITISARTLRKARLPGPTVKPQTVTYLQRPSDLPPTPASRPGFHPCHDLVCPRRIGLFATGLAVRATPIGNYAGSSRYAPKGLTLTAEPPIGLPLHPRHIAGLRFTPFGLDLEVEQAGARIARLRVAGRCRLVGERSACRFKTLTTQLD